MNRSMGMIPLEFLRISCCRFSCLLCLFIFAAALSGCAQTKVFKSKNALEGRVDPSVVLLLEPDVQLSLLTAGGLQEPHAEWTESGKRNVVQALEAFMKQRNEPLVHYRPPHGDPDQSHRHNQIVKMHGAVGVSILNHKYNPTLALPTKTDRFDWTLGPDVQLLKEEFQADYALFVYLLDSYAAAGRAAVIAMSALLGVAVQGGIQVGFASLVDLNTGEIVWFNRLIDETGDLRTAEPARLAIESLLTDMPL